MHIYKFVLAAKVIRYTFLANVVVVGNVAWSTGTGKALFATLAVINNALLISLAWIIS